MKPKRKRKRSQWPKYFRGNTFGGIYKSESKSDPGKVWEVPCRKWKRMLPIKPLCEFVVENSIIPITRAEAKRLGAKV